MARIDYMPQQSAVTDLNNSSSLFFDKRVTDISKFGTIKDLSAYNVSARGSLWKLGILAKLARNIGDLFSSKTSIAQRNAKTAAAIIKLRKNELSSIGNMQNKAQMLKEAVQVGVKNLEQQFDALKVDDTIKNITKDYLASTLKNVDSLMKQGNYLKVVDKANKFLDLQGDNTKSHGYEILAHIFSDENIIESKGGKLNFNEENLSTLKNDFIELTKNSLMKTFADNRELDDKLTKLEGCLEKVLHTKSERDVHNTWQTLSNLSAQMHQIITSKSLAGIDTFVNRENFLLGIEANENISLEQKNNLRIFLHDNMFTYEHKNCNDAMSFLNHVMNFNTKTKTEFMHEHLRTTFMDGYASTSVAKTATEQFAKDINRDGMKALGDGFLAKNGIKSYTMLKDYLTGNVDIDTIDDDILQRVQSAAELYHLRVQELANNDKVEAATDELTRLANEIAAKGNDAHKNDMEFYVRSLENFIGEDYSEAFTPFVSYLLCQNGIVNLNVYLMQSQGLPGLAGQMDMHIRPKVVQGPQSAIKNENKIEITSSDMIEFYSYKDRDPTSQVKLTKLMIDYSATVDLEQAVYHAEGKHFLPQFSIDAKITPIGIEN